MSRNPGPPRPEEAPASGEQVDLEKVLVIALHQQPPTQDTAIRDRLDRLIAIYLGRLRARSGGGEFDLVPGSEDLRFYQPVTSLLWGTYDHATFYLADDLESVVHVASSSGATAQEFIFGSPFVPSDPDGRGARGLDHLFRAEREGALPLLSVSRIKLPDYLLSLGASALRAAMAGQIRRLAAANGVVPVILRCWSWPELAVVLLAESPRGLFETIRAIEETPVGALRTGDPHFDAAFRQAVEGHPVAGEIARLWVEGPPRNRDPRLCDEEILKRLDERHALVTAKSQIGILETSWPRVADALPAVLRSVGDRAFRPRPAPAEEPATPDAEQAVEEFQRYRDALVRSATLPASPGTGPGSAHAATPAPFVARISILVKPGHRHHVRWYLIRLAQDLPDEISLRTGSDAEGTTLLLRVRLRDRARDFARLLTISHWLRVWEPIRPHVVDVSTVVEEIETPEPGDDSDRPPLPEHTRLGQGGYPLLHKRPSAEAEAFGRYRAKLLGLGRVESRSLHAWKASLAHTASRPEMYGAMMELHTAAGIAYTDLVYGSHKPGERRANLAQEVRDLLRHGRTAYNQRLQFSPVMGGAPPISGQLPYGINQIVGMLDGVAAAILQVARCRAAPTEPRRSTRELVIFEPDVAIATEQVLDVTVLNVNLLQALSPLSLGLLFHELGHVVASDFWVRSAGESVDPQAFRYEWQSSLRRCVREMGELFYSQIHGDTGNPQLPHPQRLRVARRIENFLEDIFPHAVWRRLGCGNDWDLFITQFLAGQAMGLRTRSDPGEPILSLVAWAETAVHLAVQKLLQEVDEDVEAHVACLASEERQRAALREVMPAVLRFASTELEDAADAARELGWSEPVEKALGNLCTAWINMLVHVASDPSPLSSEHRHQLAGLFAHLRDIESAVEEAEAEAWRTPAYARIVEDVRHGRPALAGWDVLTLDCGPSMQAFLWARQILRAVTEDFRSLHRGGISLASFRRRALHPDGAQPPERLDPGLYTDHTGGLVAAGREARLQYLRVSNAAFESLWELTSRILAGRVQRFLLRRRSFARLEGAGRARVRLEGEVVVEPPLRNYSPCGVSVGPAPELAALAPGDSIEVQRRDGRWLEARVVWAGDVEEGTVGAELMEPKGPPAPAGHAISRRLQMDPHWIEVVP